MKKLLKYFRKEYEAALGIIIRSKLEITIFNPRYLSNYWLNKNIKSSAKYTKGILLDIGCGNEPYYTVYINKVDKYFGLDLPTASKVMEVNLKPDIISDANFSIPCRNESIDTVLLLQVLEHLAEPEKVISETKRILRKGGVLILSSRQLYPVHGIPFDFFRFTKYGLEYLLIQKNRFKIEEIEAEGSFWPLLGLVINIFLFDFLFKSDNLLLGRILYVSKFILTPILLLLISMVNSICFFLSLIFPQIDNFALNYFIIAKK
ncbi:MAG: class I SAM-dependent methyltransferase [Candidatus Hodarchaeota archaeon]